MIAEFHDHVVMISGALIEPFLIFQIICPVYIVSCITIFHPPLNFTPLTIKLIRSNNQSESREKQNILWISRYDNGNECFANLKRNVIYYFSTANILNDKLKHFCHRIMQ